MVTSKIEWTDETWNPFTGCSPISEGCQNCYAKRMAQRLRGRYGYPKDDPFRVTFHPNRMDLPWYRKPRRIFVCSMGDLFHEEINLHGPELRRVFRHMVTEDEHRYILLTKRPQRMATFVEHQYGTMPSHIWLGVTAENQARFDERVPVLAEIPAAVRFVSIEPMLGAISLFPVGGLDWVIVGAETGAGARPMQLGWARSVRDECKQHKIPFFMKKIGTKQEPPEDLMIRQWPVIHSDGGS